MSEIIQPDSELRQYIPNVLATAEGEPSLFEKLKPYLDSAEQWALQYFGSENVIHRMYSFGEEYKIIVSKMVAYQAFMQAIPNLDLVLTPNGFGIVNNSNVASASKERVERLLAQLEAQRDNAIGQYLRVVYFFSLYWEYEPQGLYFMATNFQNLDICDLCEITAHRWNEYQRLRQQILVIEQDLSNEYFSPEQMAKFRKSIANRRYYKPDTIYTQVIEAVRSLEVAILTDKKPHPQTARDIVNIIRNNPASFQEWHSSATAKLFVPELLKKKVLGRLLVLIILRIFVRNYTKTT